MRKPQISIRSLATVIVLAGLIFAAYRSPTQFGASVSYTIAVGTLLFSLVGVIVRRGNKQLFWIGFTVFGWGYLLFSLRSGTLKPPEFCFMLVIDDAVLRHSKGDEHYSIYQNEYFIYYSPYFYQITHSIIALICGVLGSVIVRVFATKGDNAQTGC